MGCVGFSPSLLNGVRIGHEGVSYITGNQVGKKRRPFDATPYTAARHHYTRARALVTEEKCMRYTGSGRHMLGAVSTLYVWCSEMDA